MFTVTDRAEPARGFRPQSLPAQAGCHGFYVIQPSLNTKLVRQAWRTIALFCVTEYLPNNVITDKAELLTPVYLMTTLMPDVPAAIAATQLNAWKLITRTKSANSVMTPGMLPTCFTPQRSGQKL